MQSVNWADLATQASAEYVPIPVGSYTAIVTNAEATQSSTGKLMFVLQLHIVGGAHDGRTLRNNVVLTTTTPQAIEMFFRNMEALGLPRTFFQQQPQPTNELIAQKLINAYVQIEISHRAYNGRMTENVTSMAAVQGQAGSGIPVPGAIPAAPVAPPAPPAYAPVVDQTVPF